MLKTPPYNRDLIIYTSGSSGRTQENNITFQQNLSGRKIFFGNAQIVQRNLPLT
jgi:hypothetical protein